MAARSEPVSLLISVISLYINDLNASNKFMGEIVYRVEHLNVNIWTFKMSVEMNVIRKIKIYWCVNIDVAGGAVGIGSSSRPEQTIGGAGKWLAYPFFLRYIRNGLNTKIILMR